MDEAKRIAAFESPDLLRMVKAASPILQMAIEQNLTVNIFKNDLEMMGETGLSISGKSEHVK
jgi:hypothetical protein